LFNFWFGLFCFKFFYFEEEISFNNRKEEENFNNSKINIFFVGDIMLNRGVEYMINKEGKGDFKFSFLEIVDELKKSDILLVIWKAQFRIEELKLGAFILFALSQKP